MFCDNCDETEEVYRPIKDGPPFAHQCIRCGQEMCQRFSAGFILKGDWPGKSLKIREHKAGEAREEMEDLIENENRSHRIADEVFEVRKKGRKAITKYKEDHPDKFKAYEEGLKKGIRGKEKKKKRSK